MNYFLKFNYSVISKKIIQWVMEKNNTDYQLLSSGELEIALDLWHIDNAQFVEELKNAGIELVENPKVMLVQKIKDIVFNIVHDENQQAVKFSVYLSETLGYTYGYLSNVFSEVTYTSIENFMMIQKIELAKAMMASGETTLTETAYKLNYSSVAHLSTQFKNVTGITPSAFQRILQKRRELKN